MPALAPPTVTFRGAARTVTGSMHQLTANGKHILLDCGLFQGPRAESIRRNREFPFRAKDISADKPVRDQLAQFEQMGYGKLPVCIAKTQYSFSTNADTKGAPVDHVINVREVRLSAGAEFVVAICGEIMTMPGLPRVPSADSIDIGADGKIVGLF